MGYKKNAPGCKCGCNGTPSNCPCAFPPNNIALATNKPLPARYQAATLVRRGDPTPTWVSAAYQVLGTYYRWTMVCIFTGGRITYQLEQQSASTPTGFAGIAGTSIGHFYGPLADPKNSCDPFLFTNLSDGFPPPSGPPQSQRDAYTLSPA